MTYDDVKNILIKAANDGTLMTPKHDPYNLQTTYNTYRTVLSHDLADNLQNFISSGQYSIIEYESTKHLSKSYFEIIPNFNSGFSIPSSGVTAFSQQASSVVDRLVLVSGKTSGWHLFGEDSNSILNKLNNGDLINKNPL